MRKSDRGRQSRIGLSRRRLFNSVASRAAQAAILTVVGSQTRSEPQKDGYETRSLRPAQLLATTEPTGQASRSITFGGNYTDPSLVL